MKEIEDIQSEIAIVWTKMGGNQAMNMEEKRKGKILLEKIERQDADKWSFRN